MYYMINVTLITPSYLSDVSVIQGSIHLIQHKERSWLIAANTNLYHNVIVHDTVSMFYSCACRSGTGMTMSPNTSQAPVNSEEQRQCGHSLLTTRQVVHGPETLAGRHAVVARSLQVGLLSILRP